MKGANSAQKTLLARASKEEGARKWTRLASSFPNAGNSCLAWKRHREKFWSPCKNIYPCKSSSKYDYFPSSEYKQNKIIPIYETLYPLPVMYYCIASFLFFRLFDILKPFPINYIDKNTKGSIGIMLDDLVAGLFTIIVLTILFFYFGG